MILHSVNDFKGRDMRLFLLYLNENIREHNIRLSIVGYFSDILLGIGRASGLEIDDRLLDLIGVSAHGDERTASEIINDVTMNANIKVI